MDYKKEKEEYQSINPIINMLRSKIGAIILTVVSTLAPINSFAAQCTLNSPPVCIDSVPCKSVPDPNWPGVSGHSIDICLSGNAHPGALTVAATCWQYDSTYNCLDPNTPPAYNDTCAPIAANTTACPGYQEMNSTCSGALMPSGACPVFDVTYRCIQNQGQTTTSQDCSGMSLCVNGACSINQDERNHALGLVIATAEIGRQAGVYRDGGNGETNPDLIRIFGGKAQRCLQNTLGLSDCCVPKIQGGSYTNQLIIRELAAHAWNNWLNTVVGSNYQYDTLYDMGSKFFDKAIDQFNKIVNNWTSNGSAPQAVGPTAPPASSFTGPMPYKPGMLANAGFMVGGFVGGALGSMAGARLAQQWSANTQITGVIAALGTAAGTVAGTWAAGAVMGGLGGLGGVGAIGGGQTALSTLCSPCLVAALVIGIVMALVACDPTDIKTQLKLGAGICHHVGSYCQTTFGLTGQCMTRGQEYCCFNSKLARIIQEQGRPQIGKGWGTAGTSPDCSGFTATEMNTLNFAQMDLSEFIADIIANQVPTQDNLANTIGHRVEQFFNANPIDPTITRGVLVPAVTVTPIAPTVTAGDLAPKPPLAACNVTFAPQAPAPDGSITGTFTVNNCNPLAKVFWVYIGTCQSVPTYTSLDLLPASDITMTDANGMTMITRTLPAACFAQSNPAKSNQWKMLVNDPAMGLLGVQTAIWQ